jgi:Ca2+-binding RTX toxin-like protein
MANITGTLGNDTITPLGVSPGVTGGTPSNAADSILGLAGNDTIDGGGGDDTIDGGDGNDSILGGDGNDSILGGDGNDTIDGGKGDDSILGGTGNDSIIGEVGKDTINGGADNDLIYGDYLSFNPNLPDGLLLTSMGRTFTGSTATSTIWRIRNGFDTPQNVTLKAYGGPIIYSGQVAANTDFFVASSVATGAATHILYNGSGNQVGVKAAGNQNLGSADNFNDSLMGGDGDDTIYGGLGNDTIDGGLGNNILYGDDGNDILTGGTGDDTLTGGIGNDTLTGGGGIDQFVIAKGAGTDTVTDFMDGTDLIGLSGGLTFGQLSFSGNDISVGSEVLATLTGINTTTLTAADFIIV